MAKNKTNKVDVAEQDFLSEEQKKKQEEEERKRKEREAKEAAEKAAAEAERKAALEEHAKKTANAEFTVDNSAKATAKKHAEKVEPVNSYKKAVANAKNEHARQIAEGEKVFDNSAGAFAQRQAKKQAAGDFARYSKDPIKQEPAVTTVKKGNWERETETRKRYMTEEERAVYNYYYNKYGEEKAEEFFKTIEDGVNRRQAEAIFAGNEGKTFSQMLLGAQAGLESAKEGYKGAIRMFLGDSEKQPTTTYQYLSEMARNDLSKTGAKLPEELGGASLGQIAFDFVNTTANMLPSMLLGTLGGGAVGAVGIGASAAGNAFNEAINAGYDMNQARNYGLLVGTAEASLGYFLGGIEKAGGKINKAAMGKLLPKIDNALLKTAVNVSSKMGSEFSEEYLQEVLDPIFRNLALLEENEIELLSPEAIYSGILGALTAGGISVIDGSAGVPEVLQKTEVPVPFEGKAQPGTETALVAEKISEIENRPISEAEKAAKMEKVMRAVANTTGTPEVIAEAQKVADYHRERQAEFDEAVEIGKKLGVSVTIDSNIAGNGVHTSDGRIIINPNTENPALQVFVHELTHDIETSGVYSEFSEKILEHITEQGFDLDGIRRRVKAEYAAEGHNLTDSQIDAEVVAKYCEQHLFTDEKAIERLLDTEPNLFNRIKYWIEDMVVKFRGTKEERFLLEAQGLYEKALATRGETSGAGVEQHSLIGHNKDGIEVYETSLATKNLPWKDRKAKYLDMIKNQYRGRTVKFERNGHVFYAEFDPSSIRKHIYGDNRTSTKGVKALINAGADGDVFDIAENAEYGGSGRNTKNHTSADYFDHFLKTVQIDNKVFDVIADVEKKYGTDGGYVYTLALIDSTKKASPALGQPNSAPVKSAGNAFNQTIPQNQSDVNDQYSVGRGFDEIAAETKTPSMERADEKIDVEGWKSIAEGINPEIGAWKMKDLARVLDSAAGGNKALRQKLYELYEKPRNDAQGKYAKNYAAKVQSITGKFEELGIKAGSKESAAVQRIGEGVKEIDKHGNTVSYTLDDLKKDLPDSWKKIKEGADFCRKVYDEFLHDLNAMYSEIYPATVEQANERVSNYNIRINNDAKYIDRYNEVIEALENSKAEKQAELLKKRPNSLIYAEIQNQITNIDRKIEVAKERIERIENRKLAKEISRDTLEAQIKNGEILRNKQIKPRKDYFRHFQELTDEFAEIADIFSNDQRIPPNLAGKSETTKPRTIWTSIAQSRKSGNYYTEDAVSGLLKYTEIAEKLLVFDPLISHFRDVNSAIRAAGTMVENEVKGKGINAGQFASWADDFTNQLAGKTNKFDRWIADDTGAFGRATVKAIEALNRRVKSNAILGNFRSALVQIGNLPNAALYMQNPVDWAMGAVSLTNPTEEITDARRQSNFMNRRYMGDAINELTKEIQKNNILDKPKELAIWMLGAGDKAAAELIWHTAYSRAVRNPEVLNSEKGPRIYDNAVDYADDITRRSIGGRAEGEIPYIEESKIVGLIAPFQIEVANTQNALAEQIGKKNAAGIASFEIGVWLINTVLEGIIGDRPLGFDYIDAIMDIIKEATGEEEEEEKDIWELVTFGLGRLAGETISGLAFGAQIGQAVTGGDEQMAEDWFGDSDPTRYGTGNIGFGALADAVNYFKEGKTPKQFFELATDGKKNSYAEWSEPIVETVDTFAPLVMPWGGKQLSRTIKGADQLIRGGAYGKDSEGNEYLKFPQEYDPESIVKTILFGQYASDRGQQYIDSGFKDKLSAKQTEQMEQAENWGISKSEFYDIILGLKPYSKKEEKQQALFENENLSSGEKGILEQIIFGNEATRDYSSKEGFYRSGLSDSGKRLFDEGYSEEEIEKIQKAVGDGKNKAEDIGKIANALGVSEAEAFEIYQKREGNWIDRENISEEELARVQGAASFYEMTMDEYLKVLNFSKYGVEIQKEDGTTDYSTAMKDVVPNLMRFFNWSEEEAKDYYYKVNSFDYSREDLEENSAFELDTSQDWYEVDDKGYFVARNIIKTAEGTEDEFGNTVSGSKKAEAISKIAEALGIDEEEATIYYLAAKGDLVLSAEELSTAQRKDLEAAISYGWTERQFFDAVNIVKAAGADSKTEIINALTSAGAPYAMAVGYYNLTENKDYYRQVEFKYGMKNKKQEMKGDYFLKNYNADGSLTAEDIANWYAAGAGCRLKQEYIDAYMSAGATYSQALAFYKLIKGNDKSFESWYKENGG